MQKKKKKADQKWTPMEFGVMKENPINKLQCLIMCTDAKEMIVSQICLGVYNYYTDRGKV